MAAIDSSPDIPNDKSDPPLESTDERKPSQSSTTDPSGSSSNTPNPRDLPVKPVVDKMEQIEPLPSPKQAPPPPPSAEFPPSLSSPIGNYLTMTRETEKEGDCGCRLMQIVTPILGFLLIMVTVFYNTEMVELYMVGLSIMAHPVFTKLVRRGLKAKELPFIMEDSKRNRYEDVPSLMEGNPMEPPCPRPQRAAPKEQVYQADVHHVDVSFSASSPSTSSAAKGVDPKEESSGGGATSMDIHPSSQDNKDDSEKDIIG